MDTATVERLVDLVLALDAAGVQELRVEGDRLRFRPASVVPPELLSAVRENKAGLLAALSPKRPATGPTKPTEAPFGFSAWQFRPDLRGRLGLEAPDLPEADRWWGDADFESLPQPSGPCPECGSLGWWPDLAGNRHCGQCERDKLERSFQLVDKARWLRPAGVLGMLSPKRN